MRTFPSAPLRAIAERRGGALPHGALSKGEPMTNGTTPPSLELIDGKYQLVRRIGRGGMGSVWEARHVSLGTSSAIKFIESEYADSSEARTRFDKEARAAATIQSKHAIHIYDHGVTHEGKPYIVMELLRGEPLDKRIERVGRLGLKETARILQQVCRGVARAHERGIIHRDLKPENIFLSRTDEDEDEVAKVLDFGIAKMASEQSSLGVSSSTKTGAVLGTPFYMSPEQARGLRMVDHRTDVWSVGVIAYKCVTGRLPFEGESVGDLLVKICTAPLPVPSEIAPGLPPTFDAWFAKALDREPSRRFASVVELAEALAFVAGITAQSGPSPSNPMQGAYNYLGMPAGEPTASFMPVHGAMTQAPLSDTKIPGLPSRRSNVVVSVLAGVLAIGGGVGALLFVPGRGKATHATAAGALEAPVTSSTSVRVLEEPGTPLTAVSVDATGALATSAPPLGSPTASASAAAPKAAAKGAGKKPSLPALPAGSSPAANPVPVAPVTPGPKRPSSKDDPGY